MSHPLVIVGNGGLSREIRHLVRAIDPDGVRFDFKGFIGAVGEQAEGTLMDDNALAESKDRLYVVIAIGHPPTVQRLYQAFKKNPHLSFPNIIHPENHIPERTILGEGNVMFPGSHVSTDVRIGDTNVIYPFNFIGHDSTIGSHCLITPHCSVSGHVEISDSCLLGTGCRLLPQVRIADGTRIGSGAVVHRSIQEPNGTYVGIPAVRK